MGRLTAPSEDRIAAAAKAFARNVPGDEQGDDFWGGLYEYDSTRPVPFTARLSRAVAVTHYDGRRDQEAKRAFGQSTVAALERWVQSMTAWLEVLALIDVGPGLATVWQTPQYVTTLPIQVNDDGALRAFTRVGGTFHANLGGPRASPTQWRSAVSHANAGDIPPSEHLFLRDARAALRRNELRRAVIDAGTASEVALSNAIRQQLTNAGRDIGAIDQVLRTLSGVIDLYDLYSVLDAPLPVNRARVMDQVAAKRNDAAHAGIAPSTENARWSIDTATNLVRAISPFGTRKLNLVHGHSADTCQTPRAALNGSGLYCQQPGFV